MRNLANNTSNPQEEPRTDKVRKLPASPQHKDKGGTRQLATVKGNESTLKCTPKQSTTFFGRGNSKVNLEQTHHSIPLHSRAVPVMCAALFFITLIFLVAIWSLVSLDSTMNLIGSWIAYACNLFARIGTIMHYTLATIALYLLFQFVVYMDHLIFRFGVCFLMGVIFLWNLVTSCIREGVLEFQSQGFYVFIFSCSSILFALHRMITLPKEDQNHRDFYEKTNEMQAQLCTFASSLLNLTGWFGVIMTQVTTMLRNLKDLLPDLIVPFVESCTTMCVSLAPGIVAIFMRAQSLLYAHPYIAGVATAITGLSVYFFWSSKEEDESEAKKNIGYIATCTTYFLVALLYMGCTVYVVSLLLLLFYFLEFSIEAQKSEQLKSQRVMGCVRPPGESDERPLTEESAKYEKEQEEKEHEEIQKIKESNHLVVLLVFAFLICGVLFGLWTVTLDTSNATTPHFEVDGVLLNQNTVTEFQKQLSEAQVTIKDNNIEILNLKQQLGVLLNNQTDNEQLQTEYDQLIDAQGELVAKYESKINQIDKLNQTLLQTAHTNQELLQKNEQLTQHNEKCTLENDQHQRNANAVVLQDKDTHVSTMLETTQDISNELLFVLASKMQGSVVVRIDELDIRRELTHQFGLTLQGQTQTLVAANEEFQSILSLLFANDQSDDRDQSDDHDQSKWNADVTSNPLIDLVYIIEKYAPRIFSFQNVAEETLLRLKSDLESMDSRNAMYLMYTKISHYLQYQLEHDAFSDELFLSHAKSLEKIDLLHALHSRDDHSIAMCVLLQESLLHLDKQPWWSSYFGSKIDKPDVIRAHLNTLHATCRTINVETVQVLSLISWPSQTFQVKELSLQFKKVLLTRSNLNHVFQSPILQALDKVSQEPKAKKSSWALGWQSSEKNAIDSSIKVLQALQDSKGKQGLNS